MRSPKKYLFAVWILRCISRLTSFVGVIRDPRYRYCFTTSKFLWPIATLCPTSRIVLSFRAAIIYFVFFSFILTLLLLLLFPMLSKHPKRLTDSYRRYLYHRQMGVVMFRRTITSSTTLKSSVDNTSPCLNPCRVSKDSEQLFCILTQHVTIVSVALLMRIVGKLSSDMPM
jgi:uncharacterized integral membrane protein